MAPTTQAFERWRCPCQRHTPSVSRPAGAAADPARPFCKACSAARCTVLRCTALPTRPVTVHGLGCGRTMVVLWLYWRSGTADPRARECAHVRAPVAAARARCSMPRRSARLCHRPWAQGAPLTTARSIQLLAPPMRLCYMVQSCVLPVARRMPHMLFCMRRRMGGPRCTTGADESMRF